MTDVKWIKYKHINWNRHIVHEKPSKLIEEWNAEMTSIKQWNHRQKQFFHSVSLAACLHAIFFYAFNLSFHFENKESFFVENPWCTALTDHGCPSKLCIKYIYVLKIHLTLFFDLSVQFRFQLDSTLQKWYYPKFIAATAAVYKFLTFFPVAKFVKCVVNWKISSNFLEMPLHGKCFSS